MNVINRFKVLSFFLVAAYLLAACGGTLPTGPASAQGLKVKPNIVAFTGIVEAMDGAEWTVGGQKITLDPQVSLDPNIALGDQVKVEANVLADGAVVALKVESSGQDDSVSTPSADASSTLEQADTSSPAASTPFAPQAANVNENEVFGTVQALTANTITVNGVTYALTNSTEFKDALSVGDQVKLHVSLNADGTLTVREAELSAGVFDDNTNASGSDDGLNHDANDDNSNNNSNDDSDDDDSNDNGDDHGGSGGGSGSSDDD